MNADAEREAVQRLCPKKADKVLVIGFGPGIGLEILLSQPVDKVVGVDPSKVMNKISAKRNSAALNDGRLVLIDQTVAQMEWSEQNYFDGVIAVHTLQMCRPFSETASQLANLVKKGGRLVSITHGWAAKKDFGEESSFIREVCDGLRDAGFASVSSGYANAENGTAILIEAVR